MSNIPTAYIVAIPDENGAPRRKAGHLYSYLKPAQEFAEHLNKYGDEPWHIKPNGTYKVFASQGWEDVEYLDFVNELNKEVQKPSKS
ncbi:hypothetical protein PQ472_07840 [Lacticaseibacillus pabuli]|uniref:Uncharacterized protein n=1 Tax=Lacticaseibacillus pabuli TaxID=3025672 RepID=A0ABY7WQA6_9LACO|nr:hypothetical protein [Lacticaseibacillus sp. KACC 23028]WDF81836.1 hypothetical protein PQ472_07840 [Lacticaseibacillus sp. KACC 23028]